MPLSSASVNPMSTQVLGTIPAIFRDDNASYYSPAELADDATEKLIDDTTSTIPENSVLMVVVNDATYGRFVGTFLYSAGAVYELQDTSTKFAAADTDTFVCLYVSSNDLFVKNRTGATLAAGTIRIYRLL